MVESGNKLGKYALHEQLGRGGFGTVYRAHDLSLDVERAVKVLHPVLSAAPEFIQRFRREARIAARLDHPYIVPVYEFGEDQGYYYLVMKYLPGGSLKDLLTKGGPLAFERALEISRQVAAALDYAFAQPEKLIHRDIKPGNILFDANPLDRTTDTARLADFGFAKALGGGGGSSLSVTGGTIGTPSYMPPEVWRHKQFTPATDVYSLGCLFYEMITGQVLFEGDSPADIMTMHVLDGPRFPVGWPEGVPAGIETVLTKALAQKPEERFDEMNKFVAALQNLVVTQAPVLLELPVSAQVQPLPPVTPEAPSISAPGTRPVSEAPAPVVQQAASDVEGVLPASSPIIIPASASPKPVPTPRPGSNQTPLPAHIPASVGLKTPYPGTGRGERPRTTQPAAPWQKALSYLSRFQWFLVGLALLAGVVLWVSSSAPAEQRFLNSNLPKGEIPIAVPADSIDSAVDGMRMLLIPAGEFTMGTDSGIADQGPAHTVTLDAFWFDQTEVSNGMYAMCVQAGACAAPINTGSATRSSYFGNPEYINYPVIYVDWNMANAYCAWAGRRLPSEAEWEKVARGAVGYIYPWGNEIPGVERLNFDNKIGDTLKIDSYPSAGSSPYAAQNMAGNVWEWVNDYYSETYYQNSPASNPPGPLSGDARVLRGGSWYSLSDYVRSDFRLRFYPSGASSDYGFRCASSH